MQKKILANALRALSIDAVEQANSGHPGMPLGMADIAEVLWNDFLQHNPANPHFVNRDRFVLSNGHGSMLLYALLHLSGYDLSIEDLQSFRQLHSKTPGHPEYRVTPGVESTTGPLGQGLANAVGMALSTKILAARFNKPHFNLFTNYTYCFVGDGCLMEGISHEAASFAGNMKLNNLIVVWDDNGISIDGKLENWFQDNIPQRFLAYGWEVIEAVNGHDAAEIYAAFAKAKTNTKPTLLCCKTTIGFGTSVAGTEKAHGSPLGAEATKATKKVLEWPYAAFEIPVEIYMAWNAAHKGKKVEAAWQNLFTNYKQMYPREGVELCRRLTGELPNELADLLKNLITEFNDKLPNIATRKASHKIIETITAVLPELIGGSADLSESNATHTPYSQAIHPRNYDGNYLHYGVREFGMSAIMNGMALFGGIIPFGGTFLTFIDYARNAVRMAALMQLQVIFVLTHDSIGLGEDGPTHQPIEHLNMLRMTPNVTVWRPCDSTETVAAWSSALHHKRGPTCLSLSRQALAGIQRTEHQIENIARGGYVLVECSREPDAIIIATGSEVILAVEAAKTLQDAYDIRVVSMACVEVFKQQDIDYQENVLPSHITARIAVEAGASAIWHQVVGTMGQVIGLDHFGESAPAKDIYQAFNLTSHNVGVVTKAVIAKNRGSKINGN